MKIKITLIIAFIFNQSVIGQVATPTPAFEVLSKFNNIRDLSISNSGTEAYTTVQSPLGEISALAQLKKIDDQWGEPKLMSFSGKYKDLEPFLSKDNLRLYFASNRPLTNSTNESKDYDIWYVERETITAEWGKPINIGAPINTEHNEFYPAVAQNNNLYFTSDNPKNSKGKDDIFYSIWKKDGYTLPISLSDAVNTNGYEFNAYISFDERYIIFSGYNRKDGMGSGDLYISFRDDDKKWGTAINLGPDINSKYMDYCPFINQEAMTLYFTSKRSSYKEIQDFQSMQEVIDEINAAENGLSKIYKAPFSVKNIKNK